MSTLTLIDLSRQLDCVVRQNKILFEIVDIFVDNFSTFKDRVRGLTSTQQSKIAHLKRCFGDLQVKYVVFCLCEHFQFSYIRFSIVLFKTIQILFQIAQQQQQ
jgi:hypothetical protein